MVAMNHRRRLGTPWQNLTALAGDMTMPAMPDTVLYRAIVANLQTKLKRREHLHVYFERRDLSKATEKAKKEADAGSHGPPGRRSSSNG